MLNNKRTTKENINKILEFLPYFESKEMGFYSISKTDLMYPYIYDKSVDDFEKALYDENIMIVFDWGKWQPEAEKYFNDPSLLGNADLETLRKLLTVHMRKERFCCGHLAMMIDSGHILNILKRLRDISISEM